MLKSKFLSETLNNPLPYFGPELRSHFILEKTGMMGPAIIAFVGPCDVKTEALVDWEDRLNQDHIRAESMVHFIGEFFGISLLAGVFYQRLFASLVLESLQEMDSTLDLSRSGDDLYLHQRENQNKLKLSVSIVTATPVSVLFHFGLNCVARGAPVPAAGLSDLFPNRPLNQVVHEISEKILDLAKKEFDHSLEATYKVMTRH